jgi:predicted ATPase
LYLSRLHIKNYMIHQDTEVDLYPITVFVGLNNSGKSALFDALLNFSMVSRGKLHEAFQMGPWSFAARKHHGASPAARIAYSVDVHAQPDAEEFIRYSIQFREVAHGLTIMAERVELHPEGDSIRP